MAALEEQTGKRFGDSRNALLVSVRSGAAVSMPGMMDTVLNLGLTLPAVRRMAKVDGEFFAWDCYRRFLRMFGTVVLGIDDETFAGAVAFLPDGELSSPPKAWELTDLCHAYRRVLKQHTTEAGIAATFLDSAWQQLEMATVAVLESWNSDRARVYRALNKIPGDLGTAVNVQSMAFGNRGADSGTGVVFSHDVITGDVGMTGEFVINAQGEDIVAGIMTPQPIELLRGWNSEVYAELAQVLAMMAERRGKPVEVEFTVERGRLFVLQVRAAKLTAEASMTLAVRDVFAKRTSKEEALGRLSEEQIEAAHFATFAQSALDQAMKSLRYARGNAASPGCAVGRVVHTSADAIAAKKNGEAVVLVRPDTKPEDLEGMMAAVAIVTRTGGNTSHAAVVARGLGKPAIVGCSELWEPVRGVVSVDGGRGVVVGGAVALEQPVRKKEVNLFVKWAQQVSSSDWPKPQLSFLMYEKSVCLNRLVCDFYVSDMMARLAKRTVLQKEAAYLKLVVHSAAAEVVAMYITSAVCGELRHASVWSDVRKDASLLQSEFGVRFDGNERAEAQRSVVQRLAKMSEDKHRQFLVSAEAVFRSKSWSGWAYGQKEWAGGVGGPPWANIAKAVLRYMTGEWDHTTFTDHAFDLEHNNGTVFGKNRMLTFNPGLLHGQLDAKKHAEDDVVTLWSMLSGRPKRNHWSKPWATMDWGGQSRQLPPSDVDALVEKGMKLGVWKDSLA